MRLGAVSALSVGLAAVLLPTPASAVDCGCKKVTADSFSDSGTCVVRESKPSYCTLDWRKSASSQQDDPNATGAAEQGAREIIDFSRNGGQFGFLSDPGLWESLDKFAPDGTDARAYKSAAAYLETVNPRDYSRDQVLASFAALIGSSTGVRDRQIASLLLQYLASFPDQVFGRLQGNATSEPDKQKLGDGTMFDFSTYGCLEVRYSADGDPEDFDFLIGSRTRFAEGGTCARRPQ